MNRYRIVKIGFEFQVQLKSWWGYRTLCVQDNFDTTGVGCAEFDLVPINFKTMSKASAYIKDNISKKESFT